MMITTMNMGVRNIFGIIGLFFFLTNTYGQIGVKNTFSLEGGVGGNAYKWQTNQSFGSTVAASWDFNIMAGYYFHDRVNVNLEFEMHNYITGQNDSSSHEIDFVGSYRTGVGLRYAVVDNPKYQLLIGGTVGVFNFAYNIHDSTTTASFKAEGIYQTYGITNKFNLGKSGAFGLMLKAGFVNNPMSIKEIVVNDQVQDEYQGIAVNQYRFNSLGYYLKFGLTYSIIGNRRVRANFKE